MVFTKNKNSGLTLVEALVTISLLAILTTVVVTIFISSYQVVNSQKIYVELQQEGAKTLKEITKYTNLANIIIDYPESVPTYVSGNDTLALKINAVDSSNNIIENIYDFVVFYPDGDKLKMILEADPASTGRSDITKEVTDFVEKIIFRYNKIEPKEADIVYITLIYKRMVNKVEKEIIFKTSAFLRNKMPPTT